MEAFMDQVKLGRKAIPYCVRRSPRRTTISIVVDASGVTVTAPTQTSVDALREAVLRKGNWILEKQSLLSQLHPPPPPRAFVSGETVLYLGRGYRLRVLKGEAEPLTALRGRFLEVALPPVKQNTTERRDTVQAELVKWYRRQAARRLQERVELYSHRLGVPVPPILIREQQKRWGSCDRHGALRFNWRIILAPLPLVDYVVAHELCHLLEPSHGPRFWKLLRTVLPDADARRQRLMIEGPRFTL